MENRLVSIFSSKGGTGTTFLTANLALAMAELSGEDTAVVDFDADMGDLFAYFGCNPAASMGELMTLGKGATREEIRAIGVEVSNHVWAFGSAPDALTEPPSADATRRFLEVLRGDFTYVFIDASGGDFYWDCALACFEASDSICLVTGPHVVGVLHLKKGVDTLTTVGVPRDRLRIVLNAKAPEVDPRFADEIHRGMGIHPDIVVLQEPLSGVSQNIKSLALKIALGWPATREEERPALRSGVEEPSATHRALAPGEHSGSGGSNLESDVTEAPHATHPRLSQDAQETTTTSVQPRIHDPGVRVTSRSFPVRVFLGCASVVVGTIVGALIWVAIAFVAAWFGLARSGSMFGLMLPVFVGGSIWFAWKVWVRGESLRAVLDEAF